MNKTFTLFFLLGSLSVLLLSHSNGVFILDYTGNANTPTQHCASAGCHATGFSGDGSMQIQVLNGVTPVNSYTPGATYTISITRPTNAVKVGMQSGIFKFASNVATGHISNNIMPNNLQLDLISGDTMISHTSFGSTACINAGVATWKYSWTAPSANVGAIDVYCVMNISNNDGAETGDSIMRNIFTLQQPTQVNELSITSSAFTLFPNPAQNEISFKSNTKLSGALEIHIYAITGKRMLTTSTHLADIDGYTLDISTLPPAFYFCILNQNGVKTIHTFTKN